MEENTKDLKTLVNKYSQELLNSIEHKSFTEENIKNMLLTNARILSLLSEILSQLPNTQELEYELSQKIKNVQNKLNKKLNTEIYKNHTHKLNATKSADKTSNPNGTFP